ncbi:uncharacterized protein LOC144061154 [Vanacampus margaritifer]
MMARFIFALFVLVLAFLCKAHSKSIEDFCTTEKPCPPYELISANADFETRMYEETCWITTQIQQLNFLGVLAAYNKLENFHNRQKAQGNPMFDTLPGIITVVDGSNHANMSWFVPNGIQFADISDPHVVLQTRPSGTVYVRISRELPSLEAGKQNAGRLRQHLTEAGKSFVDNQFSGAGYASYWAPEHYNEVWISEA